MIVEKRFFNWNDKFYDCSVKLGDEIDELLASGKIKPFENEENGKIEYKVSNDENIWVGLKNNKVSYLFYSQQRVDSMLNLDTSNLRDNFPYPYTEAITNYLSRKFGAHLDILTLDGLREKHKGDFLYVIFKDMNPTNLFIIRVD